MRMNEVLKKLGVPEVRIETPKGPVSSPVSQRIKEFETKWGVSLDEPEQEGDENAGTHD